jgi:hypothetical protein
MSSSQSNDTLELHKSIVALKVPTAPGPPIFCRHGWPNLVARNVLRYLPGHAWQLGDALSMNKTGQPPHHRHELLVVEKEIEPDRQRDYAEKQLPHIGISPLQY